jgi:hypothetical protein
MSDSTDDSKIPVFKSWTGWYALVLIVLVIQILLYYGITRYFA